MSSLNYNLPDDPIQPMLNSILPDDLLVLILLRLPPKVVVRFKRVSKSWNSLLSSQRFLRSHQKQAAIGDGVDQTPSIITIEEIDHDDGMSASSHQELYLVEFSVNPQNTTGFIGSQIQRLHHPYDGIEFHQKLNAMIVGSCNGLLCQFLEVRHCPIDDSFVYHEYDISLYNPLTKWFWELPECPAILDGNTRYTGRRHNSYKVFLCGFGYDDVHDDYKVVVANWPYFVVDHGIEVYSLRSNAWTSVRSHPCLCSVQNFTSGGVFVNCALHWRLRNFNNDEDNGWKGKHAILAFDLRTDKNKILPLPDLLEANEESKSLQLCVLNDCLAINNGYCTDRMSSLDLWIMKDYGLKDSWMRITIHNYPEYGFDSKPPVALLEDDNNQHEKKLIYYDHFDGKISLYDTTSHQVELFPTSRSGFRSYKRFPFVASLAQPYPSSPR